MQSGLRMDLEPPSESKIADFRRFSGPKCRDNGQIQTNNRRSCFQALIILLRSPLLPIIINFSPFQSFFFPKNHVFGRFFCPISGWIRIFEAQCPKNSRVLLQEIKSCMYTIVWRIFVARKVRYCDCKCSLLFVFPIFKDFEAQKCTKMAGFRVSHVYYFPVCTKNCWIWCLLSLHY